MRRRAISKMLGACCLLAGCAATPPPTLPAGDVPSAFAGKASADAPLWPAADWWRGFASAQLDTLIAAAEDGNLGLAAAAARVRAADARAREAGAALVPSVGLSANVQSLYGRTGGASAHETDFAAALGAGYELDFWGRNRDLSQSAAALSRASRADRETVALTVTADVANTYFLLLSLRARLAIAKADLGSAGDIESLVARRVRAGYAAPADLAQERANVAAQQAQIPLLEQQMLEARNALALLVGRPPEGFDVTGENLDGIAAPPVAPGLPSALLARRPDVASAEAALASAHADLAAARAAFFPDITLTASAGLQNPALNAAVATLSGTGLALGAGASLVQTIFDHGALAARSDEARAREDELLADYRAAALSAFSDVENALGNLAGLAARQSAEEQVVAQSQIALAAAQNRYRAGSADFLAVVDAQRTLYAAHDQLADIRRARLAAAVAFYKALGGGWRDADAAPPP